MVRLVPLVAALLLSWAWAASPGIAQETTPEAPSPETEAPPEGQTPAPEAPAPEGTPETPAEPGPEVPPADPPPPPGPRTWRIDRQGVYLGQPASFRNPAVVRMAMIFDRIPAYRQIVDERIVDSDPRYWILLERANRIFDRVIRAVAAEGGYDLICEVGCLTCSDPGCVIPDVTERACALILSAISNEVQ